MENMYLFILMCIFFIIIPGPDIAVVTKNTITAGKVGGLKTVLGLCSGLLIHTTVAVLGLSAVIVSSTILFSTITYIGAIYLAYLGVKTLWSLRKKEEAASIETNTKNKFSGSSSYKQGFLTDVLNPKVIILFLTFFPQFFSSESNTFLPFLIMGITYTVLTALWASFYVILINHLSRFLKKPKTQSVIEGITGIILIGFSISMFI